MFLYTYHLQARQSVTTSYMYLKHTLNMSPKEIFFFNHTSLIITETCNKGTKPGSRIKDIPVL